MSYNKTKNKNQNSIETLNDYIKEIYLSLDVDNGAHKKTSISFDKSMSGYIMEYFNDYNLKDIRSLDIDLFLKYLRTERKQKNGIGMAPKTVKYYLALTSIPNYPGFSSTSYKKVADSLGYSEKQIMTILKKMEDIKLVKIVRHSNQKAVKIEVDFSKKQQEEMDYENMLEKQRQVYYEKLVNV